MKKVVSVSLNSDGTIKGLLFEGNKRPTSIKTVMVMLERRTNIDFGDTGIQVVTKSDGSRYLRSKANDTVEDNFSFMAKEVKKEKKQKTELWEEVKKAEEKKPGMLAKIRSLLGFKEVD